MEEQQKQPTIAEIENNIDAFVGRTVSSINNLANDFKGAIREIARLNIEIEKLKNPPTAE
jgi:regulator of replication initiation timing